MELGRAADEYAFRVVGGKLTAPGGGGGLKKHRCPLGRRFAKVKSRDAVIPAAMLDVVNLFGIGEDSSPAIAHRWVLFPTAFPKFVTDFHIFVGQIVALVVIELLLHSEIARRAIQKRGDDVPSDSSFGQMI